jgi:hypothetical protein
MSLKALKIDPLLLAGIYRQPLVPVIRPLSDQHAENNDGDNNAANKEALTGAGATVPFLGNNNRHILLLIRNGDAAYLSEPVFELLGNLLNACKLTMNDVALVNTARGATDASSLLEQFSPEKVILFGEALPELSSGQPRNKPWEQGGRSLLLTDPLEKMQQEVQLKVPFWKALQTFFHLKK